MKTMTCQQLGGACDVTFSANTFGEMAEQSKQHGMEMLQKQDTDHMQALEKMQQLIQSPTAMKEWFDKIKGEFDSLQEDE